VSGDTIKGKREFRRNGQLQSANWEAKLEKPNPTGTWEWTANLNGQKRELTLKVKWDADKLTGAMTENNKGTPIEDGTFKNGEVSFKVTNQLGTSKYMLGLAPGCA
jgi:hypothetical protein